MPVILQRMHKTIQLKIVCSFSLSASTYSEESKHKFTSEINNLSNSCIHSNTTKEKHCSKIITTVKFKIF